MTDGTRRELVASLPYVLPFATWMALMAALPPTAASYAARSAATLAVGTACLAAARREGAGARSPRAPLPGSALGLLAGVAAGLAVLWLWICLPAWPFAEPAAPDPSPYDPAVCGWPLTLARLAGSAFVIAPVEEVFFRSFLYRRLIARDVRSVPQSRFDLQAFLWTVLIFTLEHDRPLAAAAAGAAYGLLAVRFGLASAIAAHVTTNLALAAFVIHGGAWRFW